MGIQAGIRVRISGWDAAGAVSGDDGIRDPGIRNPRRTLAAPLACLPAGRGQARRAIR